MTGGLNAATEQMGPCLDRHLEGDVYYICENCRRVRPAPPYIIVRVWTREWYLCGHRSYVEHLRGL